MEFLLEWLMVMDLTSKLSASKTLAMLRGWGGTFLISLCFPEHWEEYKRMSLQKPFKIIQFEEF